MISKPAIAGAAFVLLLGGAVAYQSFTDEETPTQQDPAASGPVRTVPLDDTSSPAAQEDDEQATTNEHEVDEPQVVDAAAQVASDAVVAYTQYSWHDASSTSWIDRVSAYGTDGFHHALVEQFGVDDPYWDREVVPNERETRTTVDKVVVSGMHEQTETAQVYTVTFRTSVKTKDMGTWGEASPVTMWVYLVKVGSGWKVADITATGDRTGDF